MSKKVIILGAGGHAKVIAEIITKSGDEVIGFLDDNEEMFGEEIYLGKKVIGKIADSMEYPDYFFVIGIGSNRVREKIASAYSLQWYTAIHPSAIIADGVEIGEGSVIMPGTVINPGTRIGKHCIVNTSVSLDHDNVLEDFVHVSPGAHLAGTVTVKKTSWICAGVTVINNIVIEENCIIGAGAVVVDNVEDGNYTYVGVPAKKIIKEAGEE